MAMYLGIDAGGTHTRARLVDEGGTVLGVGEAGPANTRVGLDAALAEVERCWREATRGAGLRDESLGDVSAALGIAGLNRRGVLSGLQTRDFPFHSIAFASDAAIAAWGAHGGGDGGIVIVGTGSIGFARIGEEIVTVGGYGFPVSDEGSGADLGLRALRRSLWARDGRIAHSPMTLELLQHFDHSPGEIVDWTGSATPADYAAFAPMVMRYATLGDEIAEPIVQEAALRIDRLARALLDRGAPACCLMGGLAELMRAWLAAGVRERLRDPMGDALDGAILLARHRATGGEGAPRAS